MKGVAAMTDFFGETLRRLRMEKNISQQQLADRLHVERSSVANWEGGRRLPDTAMISRVAEALDVDAAFLLAATQESGETPNVLLVDDERIILDGGIPVLEEAIPGANVAGFTKPSQAVEYCRKNAVAISFLDIDFGRTSGIDLCRELLRIRPRMNVIYLTAFRDYAFDAWQTGACGFMAKPLSVEKVRDQLSRLRYPVRGVM